MKERAIKIGILSVVFVLAIILFSFWTNRGNAGLTADMGSAKLPTISFITAGKKANMLVGHKREMDMVAMRDTIAVYPETGELTLRIHYLTEEITSLQYEIYTLDGKEKLYQDKVNNVEDTLSLSMGNVLKTDQEGILKIMLMKGKVPLYYYTRVVQDQQYQVKECLDYVESLHNEMLTKQDTGNLRKGMEPNEEGDNTTLAHVTIHSDLDHAMWGDWDPEVVGEVALEIKEVGRAYTSVLLRYQVKCAGDNNKEEHYLVKEFFKVSFGTEGMYLLEYDRVLEEVFDTSNIVLSGKGIILGIAKEDMPHKVNQEGTIVAFVQGNELWSYSKEEDAFSLVFSFANAEKEDARNRTDRHSIRILSMENHGNMTFSVCGYMNRGTHEGESGVAIYYYHGSQNAVEEVAFLPSTKSHLVIEQELNELAYYNQVQEALYVMVDGELQKLDMKDNERTVLIEGLQKGQYVASDDGHLLAYQKNIDGNIITGIWDFAKNIRQDIPADAGETIVPLGFVENDFVYGIALPQDVGYDASGAKVQAMYRLEIRNEAQEIIKTYQEPDVYILGVTTKHNLITLRQGVKNGDSYREISEDYITNTGTSVNEFVELETYWTDLKETQYRFAFSKGIEDKKAKTLKPKQVLQEMPMVLEVEAETAEDYFYVYGLGEQAGIFKQAGDAVQLAKKLSGVVVSPRQNYVWEDGNRVAWYRNFNVSTFTAGEGETTLVACVRKVLSYEGKKVDVAALTNTSPEQLLSEQLHKEAIRFRGCSAKDMFYLMDKGVPVIALKDASQAVLLVGYDAKTVTYIDPENGGTYTGTIEKINEMTAGSGHTFIGYVR